MLSLLIFLVILGILIIVHEFGHFIAAKSCGVRVERFAIGFGPLIAKIKGKETDFLIRLFPLGGYVKLAGDANSECKGASDEFLSKPAGKKIKIVFAGPFFNYIMAFVLFWLIAVIGFPYPAAVIGKVLDDYPAKTAGVLAGDRVVKVNDVAVDNWYDMAAIIYKSKDKVALTVERNSSIVNIDVLLKQKEMTDEFGKKHGVSIIGVSPSEEIKIVKYGLFNGFIKGAQALFNYTFVTLKGFIFIIFGIIPAKDALTGPLGIYYITDQAAKLGIVALLHLMAILNVSLAIVNLFPLPLMDGGHIVIFLIEKMRRKRISEKAENVIARIGYAFIGLLFVAILYSDISRYGSKLFNKAVCKTNVGLDSLQSK